MSAIVAMAAPACAQQPAPASQPATATPIATSTAVTSQTQARDILMRMARYLGSAQSFSVSLLGGYDAVQPSGQKIEFGENRKVVMSRPDRLRVEGERSDGTWTSAVFTGKEIVLVDATNGVYATEPQPGNLDESIVHFVRDLGMRLPLAVLLVSRMPEEFQNRVHTIDYVEKTNLLGTPSHHLAGRTDAVDFQVWVADGEKPVPLRIVLTYVKEPGQPQFRAQFSDWNLAPALNDTTFAARIPDRAQKIAFAAQLAGASPARGTSSTNKGSKQ